MLVAGCGLGSYKAILRIVQFLIEFCMARGSVTVPGIHSHGKQLTAVLHALPTTLICAVQPAWMVVQCPLGTNSDVVTQNCVLL